MGRPASCGIRAPNNRRAQDARERRPAEKKISTVATNRNKIFKEPKLTIALDLRTQGTTGRKNKNRLDTHRPSHGRSYVGILPISTILTMCSAISMATCFTFFPGNEFGFLHEVFEEFVVEDWKGLSLGRAVRPIRRIPARRFYVNPEQEIELLLRVLSTQPTDEEIFHIEQEVVNSRKVEQEPEEEPEEKPEEEPEEEPVPLPIPVGGTLSSWTARSVSCIFRRLFLIQPSTH